MVYMLTGIALGILIGLLAARFVPHNILGWVVLGLGAAAFVLILPLFAAMLTDSDSDFAYIVTIPLSIGCLLSAFSAIRKSLRTWPVWLGLGLGTIPLLFWVVFVIGELLYPH